MTQQEYEQQKCECWEEYLSEYKTTYTRTAFDFAFDRAYALGKKKETITQEEIEEAAEEYVRNNPFAHPYTVIATRESYKDGIYFALGKQEKDAEDDKTLKVNRQLFCRLCADADDYINEHLEEEDSDYSYYQGRSDALHELYRGEYKAAEDAVISGWVCRDNNSLNTQVLIGDKPKRTGYVFWENKTADCITLPKDSFPDLTWSDEPQEVEIIIKRKKK